jgi:DNA-binding CsgD family transcriptional regulator/sugar-specific transcriptional regulator TrmB
VGAALDLPAATAERVLHQLAQELLVVRVAQRPPRWSASPPRAALHALMARRQAGLAAIELRAERLQERYSAHLDRRFASDQFEVLDTAERVTVRYEHLVRSARREVLHLVMPPYVTTFEQLPDRISAQAQTAARGVRFRSLYDAHTIDDELSVMTARRGESFGELARLSSGLPMKLAIFDDDAAIMSIVPDDPSAGSLLVYSPPLLHVLRALFEELWEHGVPWLHATAPAAPSDTGLAIDPRAAEVLRLMALGIKDDAIARVLGVSRRTVQQTVTDLAARLGARTRFQIALKAQAAGWLDD